MYNKKRSRGTTRDANKRCDEESNKKTGSGFKKQAVATEIVCPPAAGNKVAQLSAGLPSRSINCGQRPKSSDEGSDEDSCTANSALASRSSESEHIIESDNQANYKTDESLSSRASEKEKLKQNDIMKRMEANRLRAKTARSKKKVMIEEMNSKIYGLSMENERLKNQNRTQQTEIEFLRNAVGLLPMPNSQNQLNSVAGLPSLQELSYHFPPARESVLNRNNGTAVPSNIKAAPNTMPSAPSNTSSAATLAEHNSSLASSLSTAAPRTHPTQQYFPLFTGQGAHEPLTQAIARLDYHNALSSGPQGSSSTTYPSRTTAGSEGADTGSNQRGPNNLLANIFLQREVQRHLQQASILPDDQQSRRDRLLLELLVEKHGV